MFSSGQELREVHALQVPDSVLDINLAVNQVRGFLNREANRALLREQVIHAVCRVYGSLGAGSLPATCGELPPFACRAAARC